MQSTHSQLLCYVWRIACLSCQKTPWFQPKVFSQVSDPLPFDAWMWTVGMDVCLSLRRFGKDTNAVGGMYYKLNLTA